MFLKKRAEVSIEEISETEDQNTPIHTTLQKNLLNLLLQSLLYLSIYLSIPSQSSISTETLLNSTWYSLPNQLTLIFI